MNEEIKSEITEQFDLQDYLTRGVERVVTDAIPAAITQRLTQNR